MYKRILVPVDGSRTADRGLAEAIKLANSHRARLCVLHVVDESVLTLDVGATMIEGLIASLVGNGRAILRKAEAKARKQGLKPQSILIEKFTLGVADVIVGQARKFRADLIVMGTHGRSGFKRVVMGSAAEGVLRNTPVPVLLVRAVDRKRRG